MNFQLMYGKNWNDVLFLYLFFYKETLLNEILLIIFKNDFPNKGEDGENLEVQCKAWEDFECFFVT